jgi:hypothetical protein
VIHELIILLCRLVDKYDALRPQQTGLMPLTTGYNGAMMAPQQTGMGMNMGMGGQQTGMGMGMGQQQTGMGMGMGMGPQQTGYGMGMPGQNPMYGQQQSGFMGRQGGYGY